MVFMWSVFQFCHALIPDYDWVVVCLLLFLSSEHAGEFGNFQESARTEVNFNALAFTPKVKMKRTFLFIYFICHRSNNK